MQVHCPFTHESAKHIQTQHLWFFVDVCCDRFWLIHQVLKAPNYAFSVSLTGFILAKIPLVFFQDSEALGLGESLLDLDDSRSKPLEGLTNWFKMISMNTGCAFLQLISMNCGCFNFGMPSIGQI